MNTIIQKQVAARSRDPQYELMYESSVGVVMITGTRAELSPHITSNLGMTDEDNLLERSFSWADEGGVTRLGDDASGNEWLLKAVDPQPEPMRSAELFDMDDDDVVMMEWGAESAHSETASFDGDFGGFDGGGGGGD